jgi:hypothetical protein
MGQSAKSFRVMVNGERWTVRIKKSDPPTDFHFDEKRRHLYLDPGKLRSHGVEYMAEAVLRVRFRHFITPAAARDAGRVVSRAYKKLMNRKSVKSD